MKKRLAFSVVAIFCLAVVAVAGDEKKPTSGKIREGTITKMASSVKMIMIKDSTGKETAVWWNDSTKVGGEKIRQGAWVHWLGAEKDGKMWATWIFVGGKKM
jgi:hypothetical protein